MYIVYLTTNIVNNKIYIGVHKTASLEFDGYIGCGVNIRDSHTYNKPKTHFQFAVKKYGTEAFRRITLKSFEDEVDALDLERWLVTDEFVKRPDTYNMIKGGGKLEPSNKVETHLYDLNGNYLQTFKSRTEASIFIYGDKRHAGNISRAITRGDFCKCYQVTDIKYPFVKDYESYQHDKYNKMCQTIKEKYSDNKVMNFTNRKQVDQYDLNGNYIKTWESLSICKKSGFTNVQAVVEGKRNQCKGFTFKYKK